MTASNFTLGITVSHHQGEMDWKKAYTAGARFALIRAGSIDSKTAQCYEDYQFRRNARLAPQIMPVSFFWFFRPQFSAVMQMDYFCDLIDSVSDKLPPTLDVEIPGSGLAASVKKALDCIEAYDGRRPMIYLRGEFWNKNIGLVYWANLYHLWVARYTWDPHPWKNKAGKVLTKVKPVCWEDWLFWQFSADGNGRGHEFGSPKVKGSDSICLEYFNGSEAELMRFAGLGQVPAPPPPPSWQVAIDPWARTMGYEGPGPEC